MSASNILDRHISNIYISIRYKQGGFFVLSILDITHVNET